MVKLVAWRGVFVQEVSLKEALNLRFCASLLGTAGLALARTITEDQLESLHDLVRQMGEARADGDIEKYNRLIENSDANGGGWPLFNMHTMAGLMNGWLVEFHLGMQLVGKQLFVDPPRPDQGVVRIPDQPGLGLQPNRDSLGDTLVRS